MKKIYHGQKQVKGLYHGDTTVKSMYRGDILIWSADRIDASIQGHALVIKTNSLAWTADGALVLQPNNLSVATISNNNIKISGHNGSI